MPRIRKKTSNRGTTHQRARVKHKVAESRKKKKKEAKKNTQWKSKHPKDPGIPNNFPYKDEILAEVAEQRRQAEEDKQRRKEERKVAKTKAATQDKEGSDDDGEEGFDGIRVELGKAGDKAKENPPAEAVEEEAPLLINPDVPDLKSVLEQADVVLHVLDARDPLPYMSSYLEQLSKAKADQKTLLVLTKIDKCPREAISSWLTHLRQEHPAFAAHAASSCIPDSIEQMKGQKLAGKEAAPSSANAVGTDAIVTCLGTWARAKSGEEPLVVGVVGLANAGKSSLINSFLRRNVFAIYNPASSTSADGRTTTLHAQEATLEVDGKHIRFIDTPGLAWERVPVSEPNQNGDESEEARVCDILLRNKGRIERVKDPVSLVAHIVGRAEAQDLMLFYKVPEFAKGDHSAFLSALARSNGLVKKAGVLDVNSAARIVLRDWSTGKFPRYTMPPAESTDTVTASTEAEVAEGYAKDEETLREIGTRKELRRGVGVVRLVSGAIERRGVVLDVAWLSGEEVVGNGGDVEGRDGDEEEEEEGLADRTVEGSGKRKRQHETRVSAGASKKVGFAVGKDGKGAVKRRMDSKRANAKRTRLSSQGAYDFGEFFK